MTIQELIEELQKWRPNAEVRVYYRPKGHPFAPVDPANPFATSDIHEVDDGGTEGKVCYITT